MNERKPFIEKNKPTVLLSEVKAEIKWRYPDLNLKTACKEFIDLMVVVHNHAYAEGAKERAVVKIRLASLIISMTDIEELN